MASISTSFPVTTITVFKTLRSSNRHILSPRFPTSSTVQNSETQVLGEYRGLQRWSWRKDAGFSCFQTSIHPYVTSLSLAKANSMWEIENVSRWRSAWRPCTEQYTNDCRARYHTTSSVIYWACKNCLYFLQSTNEHRKLTRFFCQLPCRVNPLTCFGKMNSGDMWLLSPMQ